jgi:uncharacterized membrane protein
MTARDWIKLALALLAVVASAIVLFYVTRFFIYRLPDGTFGGTLSFFLGVISAGITYPLTLGILTKLIFGRVELS